jgi:hypothetical protein
MFRLPWAQLPLSDFFTRRRRQPLLSQIARLRTEPAAIPSENDMRGHAIAVAKLALSEGADDFHLLSDVWQPATIRSLARLQDEDCNLSNSESFSHD